MPPRRKYEMTQRAQQFQRTRLRIVEAALDLHGSVGPLRASYAAIAERAGVERKTVYNHFPTEADLFRACSAHDRATNPFPDPRPWRLLRDPAERMRVGLSELYSHFRETESRWANILRDAEVSPLVRQGAEYRYAYLRDVRDVLAAGWWDVGGQQRARLLTAIGLAVDFYTWRSLTRTQAADHATAVELMIGMARCSVAGGAAAGGAVPPADHR